MINDKFCARFLELVKGSLFTHIKNVIVQYNIGNEVWVILDEPRISNLIYSDRSELECDSLFLSVGFTNEKTKGEDEGFVVSFYLLYGEDTVVVESDIFRGLIQESIHKGVITASDKVVVMYDGLTNFNDKLIEYKEISKLLIKEYLFDYHYNK